MSTGDFDAVGRRSILKAAGAGAALGVGGAVSATPGRESGPKEAEILVGTSEDVGLATARTTVDDATPSDAAVVHENDALGYVAVKLARAGPRSMRSVVDRLERQPGIEYAERNATFRALFEPDDPEYDAQTVPQQVRADSAWDTTLGSMDVTIAVVDQGIDYTHPDLDDRFEGDEGYDFVDDDDDPAPVVDSEHHGTHVAGTAAATTDNGVGIAGLSNCRLLSGRALDSNGAGSLSDIADAIQWSADQGADIVTLALGGGGETETMRNAIDYAVDNGTLPVAAAGGDGGDVSYPAAYDNCVAVSAVDADDEFASFSNYGPEISVAAPGVNVLSTVPDGEYEVLSGTSMACAAATGVAALGKSAHPDDSVQELRDRLAAAAVDIGLSDEKQGAGRVDAANIVEGGDPPNESPTAAIDVDPPSPTVGEPVTVDGGASTDPDGSIAAYEWDLGDDTTATGETVEHSYDAAGEYTVELTVADDGGKTDSASVSVSVEPDDGGDCGDVPEFSSSELYHPGDRVAYEGAIWEATWYVWGRTPSESSSYWQQVGDC